MGVEFSFVAGPLGAEDIQRVTADIWSDLVFDEAALARLKRDGLALDGVRLTGPCPFQVTDAGDGQLRVTIASAISDPAHVEILLDLWRLLFMKRLRSGHVTD